LGSYLPGAGLQMCKQSGQGWRLLYPISTYSFSRTSL